MDTHIGTLLKVEKGFWYEGYFVWAELQDAIGSDKIKLIDDREEIRDLLFEQMEGMVGHKVIITGEHIGVCDDSYTQLRLFHISVLGEGKSFMDKVVDYAQSIEKVENCQILRVGKGWEGLEVWMKQMAKAVADAKLGSSTVKIEGFDNIFTATIEKECAMLEVDIQLPSGLCRFQSIEMKSEGMTELAKDGVVFHYFIPVEEEVTSGIPENEAGSIAIGHTILGGGETFKWDKLAQNRLSPYLRGKEEIKTPLEHHENRQNIQNAMNKNIEVPPRSIEEALADASVRALTNRLT